MPAVSQDKDGEGEWMGRRERGRKMTKEELIIKLKILAERGLPEEDHLDADELLLEYIGDPEIQIAFDNILKWYS